jgi:hypothetical protein
VISHQHLVCIPTACFFVLTVLAASFPSAVFFVWILELNGDRERLDDWYVPEHTDGLRDNGRRPFWCIIIPYPMWNIPEGYHDSGCRGRFYQGISAMPPKMHPMDVEARDMDEAPVPVELFHGNGGHSSRRGRRERTGTRGSVVEGNPNPRGRR